MTSTSRWLPFEKPLQEIEEQIRFLEEYAATHGIDDQIEGIGSQSRIV